MFSKTRMKPKPFCNTFEVKYPYISTIYFRNLWQPNIKLILYSINKIPFQEHLNRLLDFVDISRYNLSLLSCYGRNLYQFPNQRRNLYQFPSQRINLCQFPREGRNLNHFSCQRINLCQFLCQAGRNLYQFFSQGRNLYQFSCQRRYLYQFFSQGKYLYKFPFQRTNLYQYLIQERNLYQISSQGRNLHQSICLLSCYVRNLYQLTSLQLCCGKNLHQSTNQGRNFYRYQCTSRNKIYSTNINENSNYIYCCLQYFVIFGVILLWVGSLPTVKACNNAEEKSFTFDEDENTSTKPVSPIQLNEANALTHTSLLKQSGRLLIESSFQMLHRTSSALIDSSTVYKTNLAELLQLYDESIAYVDYPVAHDMVLLKMIEVKSVVEDFREQIKDLQMLLGYALLTYENASLAAYMAGAEFSGVASQQVIDTIKRELLIEEESIRYLEMALVSATKRHIEATKPHEEISDIEVEASEENEGTTEQT